MTPRIIIIGLVLVALAFGVWKLSKSGSVARVRERFKPWYPET